MADRTSIEWSDATWNPVTGCTKVSGGCDHCYAETFAERFRGTPGHYFERGFDVVLRPDKLELPLRWRRPRKVFVNSMSDLFHDQVPDEYIAQVFEVMARAPHHTFQLLTKRHSRMRSLLNRPSFQNNLAHWGRPWPLPNVWLGVSTENQQWADIRIPALLETPAAVRWISAEPLLGSLDLSAYLPTFTACQADTGRPDVLAALRDITNAVGRLHGLSWVVVGGESGRGARPMHPDWARSLRDQCEAAGVPFLFKQHGEWAPVGPLYDQAEDDEEAEEARFESVYLEVDERRRVVQLERSGEIVEDYQPTDQRTWLMARVGKQTAGRELDGVTHDGYPA